MEALTALKASQKKSFGFVVDSLQSFERSKQWLDEILIEATKLFEKPAPTQEEEHEDADEDQHDTPGPVLLPQTPRIKSARAERMRKRTRYYFIIFIFGFRYFAILTFVVERLTFPNENFIFERIFLLAEHNFLRPLMSSLNQGGVSRNRILN